MSETVALVLAAGMGTRMKSKTPKVLHEVAGRPLVSWTVSTALDAGVDRCVVVLGHARELVEKELTDRFGDRVSSALQEEQNGTGHAVQCAMEALTGFDGNVMVLYGDCPLIEAETLRSLIKEKGDVPLALVTASIENPTGYGRMIRGEEGSIVAIREHKDCSEKERQIQEVNPGIYLISASFLRKAIGELSSDNAQGELYLTDVVASAAAVSKVVAVDGEMQTLRGVNDRSELAQCDAEMRLRINTRWAKSGVGIQDLQGTFVGADVIIEPDAKIEPGVHLRGRTVIKTGAKIGVGSVLTNVTVESGATLKPYSVAEASTIGERANIGPFAHLRAGTNLGAETKIGNFVETKKTSFGKGSKASHLAYIGDGIVGQDVNIGAGTIFCNYDGFQKNVTVLEDGVFIGSDSQLVAPLTVGKGAYVASGTTVTKDVPADALAISRTKQDNKLGYAARLRKRLLAMKKAAAAKKS